MSDTKRLFIGLELPDDVREALSRVDRDVDGVRWVRDDLLHVTLAFLGEVDAEREVRLREALGRVRLVEFDLRLVGVGAFGGGRPRVVWAGLDEVPPVLEALHAGIVGAVKAAGIVADVTPFHPHVTLGRMRDGRRAALQPFLDRHRRTPFGTWTVSSFALYRSVLSPRGPTYTIECRCP